MLSHNIPITSALNTFVIVLAATEIIMIIKAKYNNVLALECPLGNEKPVSTAK